MNKYKILITIIAIAITLIGCSTNMNIEPTAPPQNNGGNENGNPNTNPAIPTKTPLANAYPSNYQEAIEIYTNQLQQNNLSQQERQEIERRLQEAQEIVANRNPSHEIRETREAIFNTLPQATRRPTQAPRIGILNSGIEFAEQPPKGIDIENMWQGYINGNLIRVYAGHRIPNPQIENSNEKTDHGAIYIIRYQPSMTQNLVVTDHKTGTLYIEEATNNRLTLTSSGYGDQEPETLYFDIETAQFISSIDEIISPTPTPQPTTYP